MNRNIFENGRSPEFIQEIIEAGQKVQELRDKILRREITLDEAAKQIIDDPRYTFGFADARSMIARGLPRELCVRSEEKSGK